MKLILIAPSGGGKGSLAELIVKDYNIPNISTGDIFRKNIKEKTPLGLQAEEYVNRGVWVPDELTIKMLLDRLSEPDCKNGYIIDGFPRTLNQAKELNNKVKVDLVIELDMADEIIIKRLAGRWICKGCGKIFNTRWAGFEPSKGCDVCTKELYQRDDDKPEFIAKRLAQYREQNKDILNFYRKNGKLYTVNVKPEYMPIDTYNIVHEYLKKSNLK